MGFITRERAALQSTHPTKNVKLIICYYLCRLYKACLLMLCLHLMALVLSPLGYVIFGFLFQPLRQFCFLFWRRYCYLLAQGEFIKKIIFLSLALKPQETLRYLNNVNH